MRAAQPQRARSVHGRAQSPPVRAAAWTLAGRAPRLLRGLPRPPMLTARPPRVSRMASFYSASPSAVNSRSSWKGGTWKDPSSVLTTATTSFSSIRSSLIRDTVWQ
eukprot:scaffold4978_cov202-Prasinococcus_capsulatus_cf.AAC.1